MFDYTKTAVKKIVDDFKRALYLTNVCCHSLGICYLSYALITQKGIWFVNAGLLGLAILSFASFFYFQTHKNSKLQLRVRHFLRQSKLILKIFPLGIAVYGICMTANDVNPISLLLTVAMTASWVLQILFEVITLIIENRLALLQEALKADIEPITKAVNLVKKFAGKSGDDTEKEPSKQRIILDKRVAQEREKQKQANAQKRKNFWDKVLRRVPAPVQSPVDEEIATADSGEISNE